MREPKRLLVTGGAGFIGSAFIRWVLTHKPSIELVVNLDLLTYAGSLENVKEVTWDPRYQFVKGDIKDGELVSSLCDKHRIDTVVHFAAESHVDRSIADPFAFYETNIGGTIALLEVIKQCPHIHFHHISTDEVYGSLGEKGAFCESTPYAPNSPYSASKASSDHFVRAYANTYNLSVTTSHCSNNYGPYQYPEKLIPCLIARGLHGESFPIYGDGSNRRDWLYVDDHVEAVWTILEKGPKGEVYDIGGGEELSNLALAHIVIEELATLAQLDVQALRERVTFVADRLGHDFRYAIDCTKIQQELGWRPKYTFAEGLRETIQWYIDHPEALQKEVAPC